jgi:mannose-6-phosphate isomerase-like protein (cupin superfamily)
MTTDFIVRQNDDHAAFEDGADRGRILVFGRDTGGAYGLMEWTVAPAPAGDGPRSYGAHLHDGCEETFMVRSGQLEFLLGEEVVTLGPGDFVRAPPGVRHGYANASGRRSNSWSASIRAVWRNSSSNTAPTARDRPRATASWPTRSDCSARPSTWTEAFRLTRPARAPISASLDEETLAA